MASSSSKRRLTKLEWKTAKGASLKPKRLHLKREGQSDIFHCPVVTDADSNWNIAKSAIDSSIACTRQLTEFICCVRNQWQMGYPGTIAYINALGDAIDFRKSNGGFKACKDILDVVEMLLSRLYHFLKRCAQNGTPLWMRYSLFCLTTNPDSRESLRRLQREATPSGPTIYPSAHTSLLPCTF